MPQTEFSDALVARLRAALPALQIAERAAVYAQGGPAAGVVTYSVGYAPAGDSNNRMTAVTVDIDIWTAGPDLVAADNIASAIEDTLVDWSAVTARQGRVRLLTASRSPVPDTDEKLAHVTMIIQGRSFRRLSNV